MIIDLDANGTKLRFFQDLLAEAESAGDRSFALMRQSLRQYKGSKEIDANDTNGIDDDDELFAEDASQIRNVTYELIESEASSYIPNPSVTPRMRSEETEKNAKSVETLLKNVRNDLPFEKMNDMDERYTPIYGGSVWLVEWDDSIKTHNSVGDVKISCLSPMHFVGQPNIYEIQDMEYCFIKFDTTVEDIERKYDVTIDKQKAMELDGETTDNDEEKGTATVTVCYYKNEEDKICEYIWSGDTELRDVDDYFARKHKICKRCGKRKELCTCENQKESNYEYENDEYEELDAPIVTSNGIIPAMSPLVVDGQVQYETVSQPAIDEQGQMIMETADGVTLPAMVETQVPKMGKTRIPYYQPSLFPIVIRKNISQEDSLFGQSDCEFVRPQQMGINKVESRIMDKLMRAGVYYTYPEEEGVTELDNGVLDKGIPVSQGTVGLYNRVDLQADISQDVAEADRLYDQAKRLLGISDSFQGQHDSSAQSGIAKQLQINQSAGRLDSKKKMKNSAYADIDKIIFQLYLAYADEPRPAVFKDAWGNLQNISFNRYDFLRRDELGEYYYDDRYLFATDATIDVEASRETLWAENRQNFQTGAYGNPQDPNAQLTFWLNMEMAHYPFAHDNVERLRDQIQMLQQQQMQLEQGQIATMQNDAIQRATQQNEILKSIVGGLGNEVK